MNSYKHFDTFSGYGGFSIPAREMGWETIGFSEIDKYASGVLEYNFRGVKNYGDISKIDFRQFDGEVDIITGGTPCQDLSVAGKQAGLDGARSGLFFEFIRAITESSPKHFIWENVKGALSSSQGWDMARVQIEMAKAGYSIEWRVLNATEFSVPQNRERIFIVGTRGEGGREVLPKPEGAGQAPKRVGAYVEPNSNGNAHAIDSNYWKGTNTLDKSRRSQVIEPRAVARGRSDDPWEFTDTAPSLRTSDKDNVRAVAVRWKRTEEGKRIRRENQSKGFDSTPYREGARGFVEVPNEPVGTIPVSGMTRDSLVSENYRIRRLTPTECERLMGLPDGWTSKGIIDGQEVEISDTQRYKMCGNGVVVNVIRAIYEQL